MDIVTCNHISKCYRTDFFLRKRVHAVQNVSFAVKKNEVFGIIGKNGAGKSTTLKIILGFVRPDKGTATISGIDSQESACRNHLGYLPEIPTLYPNLTLLDHLNFACSIGSIPRNEIKNRIQHVLNTVDLKQVAQKPIRQYSKGMQQRAGIANALILNPDILILDEPMSGLDPLGRQLVLDIINACKKRGTTVLFCSHILTDVERICDRIAIMEHGKLIDIIYPSKLTPNESSARPTDITSPLEKYFLQKIQGTSA